MKQSAKRHILYGTTVGLLVVTNIALNASYSSIIQVGIAVVAMAVLLVITKLAGLSFHDIGVSRRTTKKGIFHGGIAGTLIMAALVVSFLILPSIYLDSRYNQSWSAAILTIFIYLPLRTVLIEELAFRGVLYSLGGTIMSSRKAMVASSVLFGLWHILPSRSFGPIDVPVMDATIIGPVVILLIVMVTTIAGVVFCQAKRLSGSLITPIMIHWTLNATAILLSTIAWSK